MLIGDTREYIYIYTYIYIYIYIYIFELLHWSRRTLRIWAVRLEAAMEAFTVEHP